MMLWPMELKVVVIVGEVCTAYIWMDGWDVVLKETTYLLHCVVSRAVARVVFQWNSTELCISGMAYIHFWDFFFYLSLNGIKIKRFVVFPPWISAAIVLMFYFVVVAVVIVCITV